MVKLGANPHPEHVLLQQAMPILSEDIREIRTEKARIQAEIPADLLVLPPKSKTNKFLACAA